MASRLIREGFQSVVPLLSVQSAASLVKFLAAVGSRPLNKLEWGQSRKMNWSFTLAKLLRTFLLATLAPSICLAQDQSPAPASQVIFEISTKSWDLYASSECDQILNLRLYSNRLGEYEICQEKPSESGKHSYSKVRKETMVPEKDIVALVEIVEQSGFPKTHGSMHSGTNLVDAGFTITMTYCLNGRYRKLEVVNYDPDSKLFPDWLFEIMTKASEFIPKDR